jgi:hypothetical protein
MVRALVLAMSVAITVGASQAAQPRVVTLRDLTLPAERLPGGCALSPAPSVHLDGSRVRSGLWAEFPTNPWIGTDRRLMASIREMVDGPVAVPDGPPLGAKELSRYLVQLADGVEEAYGAVYMQSDANLISVRAIRFAPGEKPWASAHSSDTRVPRNPGMIRVAIGPIVAIVTGDGECFQAVGAYLKSLAN